MSSILHGNVVLFVDFCRPVWFQHSGAACANHFAKIAMQQFCICRTRPALRRSVVVVINQRVRTSELSSDAMAQAPKLMCSLSFTLSQLFHLDSEI